MSKKAESTAKFAESYQVLEKLAEELQDNQISVDELVPRVQAALEAFKVCRTVLQETESKLSEISAEFGQAAQEGE